MREPVALFLFFMLYGFLGWAYESALCSITEKKPVNRGFLSGPICPIYGFGSLLLILTLYGRVSNPFLLFFLGMLLCSALEYAVGYLLEKLFHTKWWDYTNFRFNLHGRICLLGAVVFGCFSAVFVLFLHPFFLGLMNRVPWGVQIFISVFLAFLLAADLAVTVGYLLRLNSRMRAVQEAFDRFLADTSARAEELRESIVQKFEQSDFYNERVKKALKLRPFQDRRIEHAFPRMRPTRYDEAWRKFKSVWSGKDRDE